MTAVADGIPTSPGLLFHHPDGRSGCPSCGWSGVPTFCGGRRVGPARRHGGPGTAAGYRVEGAVRSDECPRCEQPPDNVRELPRRRERKVGRNEPCPCGSGSKYKRCCGAAA